MSPSMSAKARRAVFFGAMLGLTLVGVEGLFFVAGKVLQRKWAMWRPPSAPSLVSKPLSYEQYLERRHPLLGWPHPAELGVKLTDRGTQPNPHYPDAPLAQSCVSLYGDSFTRGGDTSSIDKNWGNLLSERLGCYVANFGMGGYGTDQAYLRFESRLDDPAPVVVLGLQPENMLRNLTRIRDLIAYERWYALKPRFVMGDDGEVKLVPIPDLSETEYRRAVGLEGSLLPLPHESFQPGGPGGAVGLEFPFTLSVARNLVSFHGARARLRGQPEWLELYRPDHPLQGLQIMTGLTRRFVDLAEQRGKMPLVVILPHPEDFEFHARTQRWPYSPLVEALDAEGIVAADFGPYLQVEAERQGRAISEYFGPTFHYDDAGNAVLARFVDDRLLAVTLATGALRGE